MIPIGRDRMARWDHFQPFPPRLRTHGVNMTCTPMSHWGKEADMWDVVNDAGDHLSHDLPCPRCGHAMHTFLACDERCDCAPCVMPGSQVFSSAH